MAPSSRDSYISLEDKTFQVIRIKNPKKARFIFEKENNGLMNKIQLKTLLPKYL